MTQSPATPMVFWMGWMKRLARAPVLHFVIAGIALFTIDRWWSFQEEMEARDAKNKAIVIDGDRVARIRRDFQRRHGVPPNPAEEDALVDQEIDEEVLYREALARKLDLADRSIQWWLIKKMRFVAEDPELGDEQLYAQAKELGLDDNDVVIRRIMAQKMRLLAELAEGSVEPTEAEVQEYYKENEADWTRPKRVSLRHVFLSRDRRGAELDADAGALLSEIKHVGPDGVADRGDPFPLGRRHRARSEVQLAKLFGPEFAAQAIALDEGGWQGPIPSAYGVHLVYVEETLPSEPAPLASVENQVSRRLAAERRAAVLERELARMRGLYEVQIEEPDDTEGDTGAS
ncbi:MAG: peptidylprolyl isomerase [Candidatus Binatia bacterium]|nr:peptidylprolyl isomerase [Candidatus Binatia bacterium]